MKRFHGAIVSYPKYVSFILDNVKDEVKDIKLKALKNPEKYLWVSTTKRFT